MPAPARCGSTALALQSEPVPEPNARKLLNDRDHDGAVLCPGCRKAIALNIGVKFRDGYALHVVCLTCPHDTSESG